jgi:hypothetical protein
VGILYDLIIVIFNHGLEVIGFFFLRNGKNNFLMSQRGDSKNFGGSFCLCCLIVVCQVEVKDILNLKLWLTLEGFLEYMKTW